MAPESAPVLAFADPFVRGVIAEDVQPDLEVLRRGFDADVPVVGAVNAASVTVLLGHGRVEVVVDLLSD